MTLTIEQFQRDAEPWLAKLKATGEPLLLLSGEDAYEVRAAGPIVPDLASRAMETVLPKRDIIVGDPDDLVHIDWSSEWRPLFISTRMPLAGWPPGIWGDWLRSCRRCVEAEVVGGADDLAALDASVALIDGAYSVTNTCPPRDILGTKGNMAGATRISS